MYLEKKTYVKQWAHQKRKDKHKVTVLKGGKALKGIDPKKIKFVVEEVAYWRKANQIHAWFCKTLPYDDNCSDVYVTYEQLQELVDTCKKVLASTELVEGKICVSQTLGKENGWVKNMEKGKVLKDPTVAEELLPSQSGFFFGGTDYDEWYWQDLVNTVVMLEPLLKQKDNYGDLYYSASW